MSKLGSGALTTFYALLVNVKNYNIIIETFKTVSISKLTF